MKFGQILAYIITALTLLATAAGAQVMNPTPYEKPKMQDSVWYAPDRPSPSVRENDAGRWGLAHTEVMERLYDISGQKSEWLLGTSILGKPELDPFSMGLSNVSERYPSMLSGIYTTRLAPIAQRRKRHIVRGTARHSRRYPHYRRRLGTRRLRRQRPAPRFPQARDRLGNA